MKIALTVMVSSMVYACSQPKVVEYTQEQNSVETEKVVEKIEKPFQRDSTVDYSKLTEAQWKEILTEQEYYILREKGTERAFTGDLLTNKQKGTYVCAGCATPLYKSSTKFKSGTGWPSFYDIIEGNVLSVPDNSYGMSRTEVVCATCKGHQGHVFTDGPQPTGLRYCINSVSMKFIAD